MKNYLLGPNGLATKIVHTRYLSRWIVMGIDVVLSTLVTVFAYWLIRFVREELVVWSWVAYLALLAAVISALAFAILHAHRVVMRFTTLRETWRLGSSTRQPRCCLENRSPQYPILFSYPYPKLLFSACGSIFKTSIPYRVQKGK